ncbi:Transcription initiation factor TFIID subunit 13 [Taenia solium]|eukprot:TsM_001031700 transcript=TsM_001031700 gene=TsM_001031700
MVAQSTCRFEGTKWNSDDREEVNFFSLVLFRPPRVHAAGVTGGDSRYRPSRTLHGASFGTAAIGASTSSCSWSPRVGEAANRRTNFLNDLFVANRQSAFANAVQGPHASDVDNASCGDFVGGSISNQKQRSLESSTNTSISTQLQSAPFLPSKPHWSANMADSELSSSDIFGIDGDQDASGSGDKKRHLFLKDIRAMLYGFGDVENPLPETVAMVEEIAVQYILDMLTWHFILQTRRAMEIGQVGKITVEDIAYLVRSDPRKFSRAKELLLLSEELNKAKKAFDNDF